MRNVPHHNRLVRDMDAVEVVHACGHTAKCLVFNGAKDKMIAQYQMQKCSDCTMKVLSIQQPWTWLIAKGYKDIENRTWKSPYVGLVALHAGQRLDPDFPWEHFKHKFPDLPSPETFKKSMTGGVIGYATLTKYIHQSQSGWFTGPYGFVFEDPHMIPIIHTRGQLMLYDAPQEVIETIKERRRIAGW